MVSTKNGRFEYPEEGWSTGRMRKKGETQLAMDTTRRGTPDTGLLTEMDRAAGFGMSARGGATSARAEVTKGSQSLSPDVIQQQKSHIEAMGNQWQLGTVDWNKLRKEIKYKGWDVLWAPLDMMPTGGPVMTRRDIVVQELKEAFKGKTEEEIKEAHENPKTAGQQIAKQLKERKEKSIGLKDPNGKLWEIPLEGGEE